MNSIAMAKVCPTAGLHGYQKVRLDGYFDRSGGEDLLRRHPYRFIETTRRRVNISRFERQADGIILRTELEEPRAEYEIVYDSTARASELGVGSMQRWWARKRSTDEAIGELLAFNPCTECRH